MDKDTPTVIHKASFYLNQMEKAVKKGEPNEMMKKYGITIAHVKKVNNDVKGCNETYHRQHLGAGDDYEPNCQVCKDSKGIVDAEEDDIDTATESVEKGKKVTAVRPKRPEPKEKPKKEIIATKPEDVVPEEVPEIEIAIVKNGKETKTTLQDLKNDKKSKPKQLSLMDLKKRIENI